MVFSSLFFLYAFFPLSMLCYMLCRSLRAKNTVLLVFSLFFYAWGEPKYVLLLMVMALADWFCALRVYDSRTRREQKRWLLLACVIDLGLIGFFKYSGMVAGLFGEPPAFISRISLPIGISFYTFQLLSYVVDVYRGDAEPQESYWNVLLYAALFHQCIAGPIVRYKTIADELFNERDPFSTADVGEGIGRFCVGLAKKTILANAFGLVAEKFLLSDSAIADASQFSANMAALQSTSVLGLWIGILSFGLQIYFDFSAYSDMAIGMGKMLGLHYLENFDYPFISKSATEFWRRWHISLGTFFRDYVYIPLGGNRCSVPRWVFNTFVVWFLTGLWHGASWNFVLWGLYYFVLLMLEKFIYGKALKRLHVLPHLYLIFVVCIAWPFFHITDLRLAFTAFKGLFGLNGNALSDFPTVVVLKNNLFLFAFGALAATPALSLGVKKLRELCSRNTLSAAVYGVAESVIFPASFLLLSTATLVGNTYNPFLYYQF